MWHLWMTVTEWSDVSLSHTTDRFRCLKLKSALTSTTPTRFRLSVWLFWHISTRCAFLPSLFSDSWHTAFVLLGHFCTSLESWPSGRLSKKFTSSRSSVVPCCPRHMGNRIKKKPPINLPLARHLLQFSLGNGEVFPRQLRSIIWSPPSQMYPKVPYQLPEDIPVRCL